MKNKNCNQKKKIGGRVGNTHRQCKQVTIEIIHDVYTGFVEQCEDLLSGSGHIIRVNLGARARTGAGTPGRVAWRAFAATRGVAARPALASAATTRAGTTVAGAARTIRPHRNVGSLSLKTRTHTHTPLSIDYLQQQSICQGIYWHAKLHLYI